MSKLKKINLLKIFRLSKFEKPFIYLLTIGLLIVVNFLITPLSLRLDLSKGKAYTLSSSTKKILHNLDDLVNIKFFVSSDLPTRLLPLKNEVNNLLTEFKKEGQGKIIIKSVDPKKDEAEINETKELGIPELQFSQLEKDKYAVSTAYFGIALSFGTKKEIIPQATDIGNLEYNLTSLIYKLTRKEVVRVGIVGFNDVLQNNPLSIFYKLIGQQFAVEPITLDENTKGIDKNIKTLIIIDDNKTNFQDIQIKLIRDYLEKGGRALFFIDGVWIGENLTTSQANHNLFNLLKDYGIKINTNLLLSTSAELVNFGNETMQFLTPYPFWLKTNLFNQKLGFFSNVTQLTFPWTSSLNFEKKNNIELTELIKTTNKSWEQKDNFNLDPQNIVAPNMNGLKDFIVAAEAKKNNSRILIIPSSRFIQDKYLNQNSSNLEFVFNILNDYASQGTLSGIRARSISFYPLPDLPDSQKDIFKYTGIFLLPLVFILYGTIRFLKRK